MNMRPLITGPHPKRGGLRTEGGRGTSPPWVRPPSPLRDPYNPSDTVALFIYLTTVPIHRGIQNLIP